MRLMRIIGLAILTVIAAVPAPVFNQGLQGDADAVAMANRMIDRMGGRRAWAGAVALHVEEEAHHIDAREPLRSEFWRFLREPSMWGHSASSERVRTFAYTATQGWNRTDGRVTLMTAEQVSGWRERWPANIYVMYHRLASGDPTLRIVKHTDQRFDVHDAANDRLLCSFVVNAGGDVVKWVTTTEEWVYGPLVDFGAIRMPAWGARLDGSYRFRYTSVVLSSSRPVVSLQPPESR